MLHMKLKKVPATPHGREVVSFSVSKMENNSLVTARLLHISRFTWYSGIHAPVE
jgi:hypothetical protein